MNDGDPRETRSLDLEGLPEQVRRWLVSNFECVRIDGFDKHGKNFEWIYTNNVLGKFALLESMRRTVTVNECELPVRSAPRDAA